MKQWIVVNVFLTLIGLLVGWILVWAFNLPDRAIVGFALIFYLIDKWMTDIEVTIFKSRNKEG